MDYFPFFAQLIDRPVLVIGGGHVAERKITLLLQAKAQIRVVAATLTPTLQQLHQDGALVWLSHSFEPQQLDTVFLVIAATNNSSLNQRIFEAAEQRQRWVNVVDDPQRCSFIFPSIVDRSPLLVAISSGGHAPVLARQIREKLEALLPDSLSAMARIAGHWRQRVKHHITDMTQRRRFWEWVFNGQYARYVESGNLVAAEDQLQQGLIHQGWRSASKVGDVALVGAGPGAVGLLTLRGLQLLQQADVVLYDHLVSDEIRNLIRRDADQYCVGKRAGAHQVSQEETNQLLVSLALEGKRVVRLKGGDPFVFGRGGEELQALSAAGIRFQVVPGITAGLGATAYAGIPLTHRDYAQCVTFITGHCRGSEDALDWGALARPRQTLVIYMGTLQAEQIMTQLLHHGRAENTPVAVISQGTRKEQLVCVGTLQQLEQLASDAPMPALLVIGEVVELQSCLAWFGYVNERHPSELSAPVALNKVA